MTIPSSFAQPDDRDDRDFIGDKYYEKDPYNKYYNGHDDPFGKDQDKEYKGANVQTIKCVNSNVNINGIDIKKGPKPAAVDEAAAEDAQQIKGENGQGNGLFGGLNIDKNLVNICVNFNFNEQEDEEECGIRCM